MKVPPIIQETQETLAVWGGYTKRFKRKLLAMQGEMEKMINEFEKIERTISAKEKSIKAMLDQEAEK